MCFSACHWARVSCVVYGVGIPDAQQLGFNELTIRNTTMKDIGHSPIEVVGGCLCDENLELFRVWSTSGRRDAY